MREIKFRAWDKKDEQFWSQKEMNKTGGFYYEYGVDPDTSRFELQQYTGLKDRHGVEIYEGDIVVIVNDNMSTVVRWCKNDAMWILSVIPLKNNDYGYNLKNSENELEVIGNQHENPELLETQLAEY